MRKPATLRRHVALPMAPHPIQNYPNRMLINLCRQLRQPRESRPLLPAPIPGGPKEWCPPMEPGMLPPTSSTTRLLGREDKYLNLELTSSYRPQEARSFSTHTTPSSSVAWLVSFYPIAWRNSRSSELFLTFNIGSMYMMSRMVLGHKTWFGKN
jgi:hypothetical protein